MYYSYLAIIYSYILCIYSNTHTPIPLNIVNTTCKSWIFYSFFSERNQFVLSEIFTEVHARHDKVDDEEIKGMHTNILLILDNELISMIFNVTQLHANDTLSL